MLRHRSIILSLRLLLVMFMAGSAAAVAWAQSAAEYERVTFHFDKPTRLTVSGSGKQLILTFDQKVTASAASIQSQIGARASSVRASADGKQVIITLDKPYRTRHFVSGTLAGLDILTNGAPPPEAKKAPEPAKKEKPPAKVVRVPPPAKPAAPTKVAPSEEAVEVPPAKPAPIPQPPVLSKKAMEPTLRAMGTAINSTVPSLLTTKKEVPAATERKVKPAAPEAKLERIAPAPSPALTTKETPAAPTAAPTPIPPVLTTKETPPTPVAKPAPAVTPAPATATKPVPAAPASAPTAEPPIPQAPEPAKAAPAAATGSFLVTVQKTADGTWINFPWQERVAAAVFERGSTIWIIFSQARDTNAALFSTLLPQGIQHVDQFKSDSNTILRLTTDGNLHAIARQPKGSYRWQILLSSRHQWASLDTPLAIESDDSKATYLLLSLFDIGTPLRFYDPQMGDLLIVLPTYEEGRGVVDPREFPALSVLATQQGVVLTSLRDDLGMEKSRVGLKINGLGGLSMSQNLPTIAPNAVPIAGASASSGVTMPYDQWYVLPGSYPSEHVRRMHVLAVAPPAARADALMSLVELTLGQGYAQESMGYLNLLQSQYPEYYHTKKLAILHAACNLLLHRPQEAMDDLNATELAGMDEAQLWREAAGLYLPPLGSNNGAAANVPATGTVQGPPATTPQKTPEQEAEEKSIESNAGLSIETPNAPPPDVSPAATEFDFLAFDRPFIRFYPPHIRQHLAMIAADYYMQTGQEEKTLKVFDTLNRDNILKPVELYAELSVGKIAAKKSQVKQALDIFDHLSKQKQDRYIQARGRYEGIMLRYTKKMITPDQAEVGLEQLHMAWHGGNFERTMLLNLAQIYKDNKQYDQTLRTWKYLLTAFPGDPDTLAIAGDMGQLFQNLFLNGDADVMPPLKSLATFYEFRELTPIGDKGDQIIQKLADRLAAVDLLDRAAQLLEHQIKFRLSGEERARVGARLALVYLLNHEPERALTVLQTTNYGASAPALQVQRQQLTAQALSRMGKNDAALSMLYADNTPEGALLRLDILWSMSDWPNIINQAEDILAARQNLTEPLKPQETVVLLKLALAYSFEGDMTQLGYLRDYYMGLVPDGPYKEIFEFITNDTAPLATEDFSMLARQISHTESFLDVFKTKIAQGKLSQTVK